MRITRFVEITERYEHGINNIVHGSANPASRTLLDRNVNVDN
jgi:hypothetical protein